MKLTPAEKNRRRKLSLESIDLRKQIRSLAAEMNRAARCDKQTFADEILKLEPVLVDYCNELVSYHQREDDADSVQFRSGVASEARSIGNAARRIKGNRS